jgi:hypothetical protein
MSALNRDQMMTDERLDSLERWRDDMERRFAEAFPGGDHVGHCRYHTLMIQAIEESRNLRVAIQTKTISGLIWAGLVVVGLAVWSYIKNQIKGGP